MLSKLFKGMGKSEAVADKRFLERLAGKLDKSLRALGLRVEHHPWLAVAGGLGQSNVARNDGVEHLVAEVRLELVAHLLLDAGLIVKMAQNTRIFIDGNDNTPTFTAVGTVSVAARSIPEVAAELEPVARGSPAVRAGASHTRAISFMR